VAFTDAQLAALEQALARGESRVRFEDKMVEYRSVEELKMAIREVKRGLFEQARDSGLGRARRGRST
jgi:hypothetical protein